MDTAEITKRLEQAKAAKARLEGQRDHLEAELKSLGHESIESAQVELKRLEEYINEQEPILKQRLDKFLADHADAIETIQSLK